MLGLGVAIAGMNLVYPAMWYLPVGVASALQFLGPLSVALLDSRRPTDLVVAALAGVGVWLVNDPGSGLSWPDLVLALLSPGLLLTGVCVAVLSAVLPYSLEQAALRRLRAGLVGVLLTTEPAVAGLAGLVILGERLAAAQWLGIAFISLATAATLMNAVPSQLLGRILLARRDR